MGGLASAVDAQPRAWACVTGGPSLGDGASIPGGPLGRKLQGQLPGKHEEGGHEAPPSLSQAKRGFEMAFEPALRPKERTPSWAEAELTQPSPSVLFLAPFSPGRSGSSDFGKHRSELCSGHKQTNLVLRLQGLGVQRSMINQSCPPRARPVLWSRGQIPKEGPMWCSGVWNWTPWGDPRMLAACCLWL